MTDQEDAFLAWEAQLHRVPPKRIVFPVRRRAEQPYDWILRMLGTEGETLHAPLEGSLGDHAARPHKANEKHQKMHKKAQGPRTDFESMYYYKGEQSNDKPEP
jgi:hypothetical protein